MALLPLAKEVGYHVFLAIYNPYLTFVIGLIPFSEDYLITCMYLIGLTNGSRMSSTREKTPRTTQYLNQAPALSGDPWRTALRDAKAG